MQTLEALKRDTRARARARAGEWRMANGDVMLRVPETEVPRQLQICSACLHACQYAPPHAFAMDSPQAMAQVRGQS